MRRIILLLFLSILPLCLSQENWGVAMKNGNIAINYKGKPIIRSINLTVFPPDYKGQLFTISKANHRQEGDQHLFQHSTDAADVILIISFAGSEMTIDMAASVHGKLPFEYGLWFSLEDLGLQNGKLFFRNNSRSQLLGKEELDPISVGEFSIEQERFTHTFTATGDMSFRIQDRRKTVKQLRFIAARTPQDEKGAVYKQRIVWSIREYDDKQTEFRKNFALTHSNKSVERIEVSNNDFEQEGAEWTFGKNVTFVQVDEKHGKSARMHVDDPKVDNVYITRLIPVVPGGRYFARCDIKTEDVTVADGKMESVGACLIVEWADANKNWIAAGVYSPKRWKTTDWTNVECKGLRAPLTAHYAFVYIALRGKGTAWYDNFELFSMEESTVKTSPKEGEVLKTNAPLFKWLPLNGVETYEVAISNTPEFPKEATTTYIIDVEKSLQLRKALQPGTWYWCVHASGYRDRSPASFVIDTPPGAAIVPPQIIADHARLLSSDLPYRFSAKADDGVKNVTIVDADDATRTFAIAKQNDGSYQVTAYGGWKSGLNTLIITATATNGASETKKVWIVCAPKPEDVIVIDKEGRYTENGQHIFPLGIYQVAPEQMSEVKAAGFEVVHMYTWEGSQDEAAAKAYMDAAQAAGIRVFIGFDRGLHSQNGIVQGNLELIARRVGSLATHPALFCWYLFDEPEVAAYYVPPKLLTAFAELLRKLDPYHPVVMTTWGKNMNAYRKTWDTHWTQCYDKPAAIVNRIAEHRKLLLNDSPITLLIHCYDRTQSRLRKNKEPVDWNAFKPDYDWMRAAAMVGIAKEVNGLWWWWYAKSANDWMTAAQNPVTWGNLCKVVEEVRSLRPILNADGSVQTGTVTVGDAKVEWWVKTINGKNTIIIVNTSETEVEATIAPNGIAPITVKLPRFGVEIRK